MSGDYGSGVGLKYFELKMFYGKAPNIFLINGEELNSDMRRTRVYKYPAVYQVWVPVVSPTDDKNWHKDS